MCECEIYEMCPECAPSPEAYQRVLVEREQLLKTNSSMLNTLKVDWSRPTGASPLVYTRHDSYKGKRQREMYTVEYSCDLTVYQERAQENRGFLSSGLRAFNVFSLAGANNPDSVYEIFGGIGGW